VEKAEDLKNLDELVGDHVEVCLTKPLVTILMTGGAIAMRPLVKDGNPLPIVLTFDDEMVEDFLQKRALMKEPIAGTKH